MITIINYGSGNLGSLLNMFKHIGVNACLESDIEAIRRAEKLLLPGVGAFDAAMGRINSLIGLREVLDNKALVDKIPILGVCLGMQMLTRSSEEGKMLGLGWIPGETLRFPVHVGLKIPHMGWNIARTVAKSNPLTCNIVSDPRYYFVHSYCVQVDDPSHSVMKTHYGIDFDAAICFGNIYGVQFHPEKSHRFGMQILKNFASL